MHICRVIQYTPFMAGVKHFEDYKPRLSVNEGKTTIGWGHVPTREETIEFADGITPAQAHDLLIADYDKIGHIVVEKLPLTETCPHWLRAWTDLCYWKGLEILDGDIAKAFLDKDYENVPYMICEKMDCKCARQAWDATIHLYGTYGLPK